MNTVYTMPRIYNIYIYMFISEKCSTVTHKSRGFPSSNNWMLHRDLMTTFVKLLRTLVHCELLPQEKVGLCFFLNFGTKLANVLSMYGRSVVHWPMIDGLNIVL